MSTLSSKLVAWIATFVASVFVAEKDENGVTVDFSKYAAKAISSLTFLFQKHEFTLGQKTGKGNKTVSHNSRERFYVRVISEKTKAPIVLKPRFKKANGKIVGLYGYHAALDSDVSSTKADIESFLRIFDPDKFAKGASIDDVLIAASSRQLSEDIGNNFAQSAERAEKKLADNQAKVDAWLSVPDIVWQGAKSALAQVDAELAQAIDELRAERKS